MPASPRLLTYPFVALCLVGLFGFANISVFYSLHAYLLSLGIAPLWCGWIVSAEPLAALLLRPVIGPWLGAHNAVRIMRLGLVGIGLSLLSYPYATSIGSLVLLRLIHGASFVTLLASCLALVVHFIPPEQSGRGFGLLTLSSLVPVAIMPPATELLLKYVPHEAYAYAWFALLVLPALALLVPLDAAVRTIATPEAQPGRRPHISDVLPILRTPGIKNILGATLFIFLASSMLFFFMKQFALDVGLGNPGFFFTVSTVATIVVRLVGYKFFDRLDKRLTMVFGSILLACAYMFYALVSTPGLFLVSAALHGAATGIVAPLMNSALFLLIDPTKRGLAANTQFSLIDLSFFLGPYSGGVLLGFGASLRMLFALSCVFALMAALLLWGCRVPQQQQP